MFSHLVKWDKRPAVYSAIISAGMIVLAFLNQREAASLNFCIAVLILYLVIILELISTFNFYHGYIKSEKEISNEFLQHRKIQLIHHLTFPTLTYFASILFIYFNSSLNLTAFIIALLFFLFYVLFENIYSFYHNEFSITKSTNYIYDLISTILVFILTNIIVDYHKSYSIKIEITVTFLGLSIFFLTVLCIMRHAVSKFQLILSIFLVVIYSLFVYFVVNLNTASPFSLALFSSVIYLMYTEYISLFTEGRLSREVYVEYFLVFLLAGSILYLYGF